MPTILIYRQLYSQQARADTFSREYRVDRPKNKHDTILMFFQCGNLASMYDILISIIKLQLTLVVQRIRKSFVQIVIEAPFDEKLYCFTNPAG